MKFSRISKKAAAVIEANRQATGQVYSNYNGQSIRLSPLIKLTTASTNVIQHRNYYSCMKGVGYNMRDNTDFKKYNATLKTTTSRWISLPTKVMLEKIVVKVPTMGDSITEVCTTILDDAFLTNISRSFVIRPVVIFDYLLGYNCGMDRRRWASRKDR